MKSKINPINGRGDATLRRILQTGLVLALALLLLTGTAQAQGRAAAKGQLPALDEAARTAIVEAVSDAMNEEYVFPEKAKKMEALLKANLKEGKYGKITDLQKFTERLTRDLVELTKDRHIRVMPAPPQDDGSRLSPEEEQLGRLEEMRYINFGFEKLERYPGNIGYIDLRAFADAGEAGATAIAAMNFFANADALIFDLRKNGGGSPSMIQLISSYLFDEPVHLNSFYIRKGDSTRQFWSQAQVEGPRLTDVPVYVLTSRYTFSAAEEFTYNLKNMERATIIGETTGGGAHPVNFRRFDDLNVAMSVPFGRAVNPVTGTNWEGTGIEPHIAVPADDALERARMEAMKKIISGDIAQEKKKRLEWSLEFMEACSKPAPLTHDQLAAYAGVYGPRVIRFEKGKLTYQRESGPKFVLLPMGKDRFVLDDLERFRIRFVKNDSGKPVKLVGLYDNGFQDMNERTGD